MTDKMDRQAALDWGKQQLTASIDELTNLGVVDGPTVEGRVAWMLPGQIMIAEIRETGQRDRAAWLIGGNVPTDHVDANVAESARDAARHFSLKWQMQAARTQDGGDDAAANDLASKAEDLYRIADADEAWQAF